MADEQATLAITGLGRVIALLKKHRRIVESEYLSAMRKSVHALHDIAATYPAQPGDPRSGSGLFYTRTGTLGKSITTTAETIPGGAVGRVGTNLSYAPFVNTGTGIYGPTGQPIVATSGKMLRIPIGSGGLSTFGLTSKSVMTGDFNELTGKATKTRRLSNAKGEAVSGFIFRRSVKGTKPWHFMDRAIEQGKPRVEEFYRQAVKNIAAKLAGRAA